MTPRRDPITALLRQGSCGLESARTAPRLRRRRTGVRTRPADPLAAIAIHILGLSPRWRAAFAAGLVTTAGEPASAMLHQRMERLLLRWASSTIQPAASPGSPTQDAAISRGAGPAGEAPAATGVNSALAASAPCTPADAPSLPGD
jgi:hypothetical protein